MEMHETSDVKAEKWIPSCATLGELAYLGIESAVERFR